MALSFVYQGKPVTMDVVDLADLEDPRKPKTPGHKWLDRAVRFSSDRAVLVVRGLRNTDPAIVSFWASDRPGTQAVSSVAIPWGNFDEGYAAAVLAALVRFLRSMRRTPDGIWIELKLKQPLQSARRILAGLGLGVRDVARAAGRSGSWFAYFPEGPTAAALAKKDEWWAVKTVAKTMLPIILVGGIIYYAATHKRGKGRRARR